MSKAIFSMSQACRQTHGPYNRPGLGLMPPDLLMCPSVPESVAVPHKRACLRQPEHSWKWKIARFLMQSDSDSERKSPEEALYYEEDDPEEETLEVALSRSP